MFIKLLDGKYRYIHPYKKINFSFLQCASFFYGLRICFLCVNLWSFLQRTYSHALVFYHALISFLQLTNKFFIAHARVFYSARTRFLWRAHAFFIAHTRAFSKQFLVFQAPRDQPLTTHLPTTYHSLTNHLPLTYHPGTTQEPPIQKVFVQFSYSFRKKVFVNKLQIYVYQSYICTSITILKNK